MALQGGTVGVRYDIERKGHGISGYRSKGVRHRGGGGVTVSIDQYPTTTVYLVLERLLLVASPSVIRSNWESFIGSCNGDTVVRIDPRGLGILGRGGTLGIPLRGIGGARGVPLASYLSEGSLSR